MQIFTAMEIFILLSNLRICPRTDQITLYLLKGYVDATPRAARPAGVASCVRDRLQAQQCTRFRQPCT
eukprot:COSAG02_NODE_346_length_24113_cov_13.213001_17_plen_68_part_00